VLGVASKSGNARLGAAGESSESVEGHLCRTVLLWKGEAMVAKGPYMARALEGGGKTDV
jgi:hypothetical protein